MWRKDINEWFARRSCTTISLKSSDVNGWNEFGDKLVRNKKPSWIKKNKCDFLMRKVMADAEKRYDEDEEKDGLRTMTFVAHETTTQF